MIIAHLNQKRKPYFINKPLNKGNTTSGRRRSILHRHAQQYIALFCLFLLGSYKGYIALWKDKNRDPVKVFPYSVESLPVADQKRLSEGIEISSPELLYKLLEDYLS